MKTRFASTIIQGAAILALLSTLDAQLSTLLAQAVTAFTYQGQLYDSGQPANGSYDLMFSLPGTGGSAITRTAVPISNGLFTTTLDFGGTAFVGTARSLQISVRRSGQGPFVSLSPANPITPVPYAMVAGNLAGGGLTGTYSNIVGFANPSNVFAGTFTGDGVALTSVNALTLAGMSAGNFWQNGGNPTPPGGSDFFGTTDNYPLNIGVNGQTVLQIVPSAVPGGAGNIVLDSPYNSMSSVSLGSTIGGGGVGVFGSSCVTNYLASTNSFIGAGSGNTVDSSLSCAIVAGDCNDIGNSSESFIGAGGNNTIANGTLDCVICGGLNNDVDGGGQALFGATIGGGQLNTNGGWYATIPGGYRNIASGIGSFAAGRYAQARDNSSFVWSDGSRSLGFSSSGPNSFNVLATGGVLFDVGLAQFDVRGSGLTESSVWSTGERAILSLHSTISAVDQVWTLESGLYGTAGLFGIYDRTAGQDRMTIDTSGNTYFSGPNVSVCTLTIRGGCDLAEPFQISAPSEREIPAGSVVVIDDQNPGRLKLSDHPYDTRVAGVISGANGIGAGIQMHQQGLLEGGKNVALSGRVYVLAEACNGAILPGDLLTTSSTPGYAMKVSDYMRAHGAILGKAMTGLREGKSTVLLLVALQ